MAITRIIGVSAFVLLGIKYLRLGQIPVFAFVILILLINGLRNRQVNIIGNNVRMVFTILWFYLMVQLFDLLRSENLNQSILDLLKFLALIIALFTFIKFYSFHRLSDDSKFFAGISAILLLAFFLNSLFVLKTSYLSADLFLRTEQGKNGLAMFASLATIVSFWLLLSKNISRRWFYVICFAVSLSSVVYTQSRGAAITLVISLVSVIFLYNRYNAPKRSVRYFRLALMLTAVSIMLVFVFSSLTNFDARSYLEELTSLGTGRLTQSDEIRKDLLDKGRRLFIDNPVLGVGSNNFLYTNGLLTHNQYLQFAVENGFFVAFGFLAVFVLIVFRFYKGLTRNAHNVLYMMAFNTSIFIFLYFIFINAYDSILIEFCLVSSAWILDESTRLPTPSHA